MKETPDIGRGTVMVDVEPPTSFIPSVRDNRRPDELCSGTPGYCTVRVRSSPTSRTGGPRT